MTKFQCKKYHGTCKAKCCGIVPIPEKLWKEKKHLAQRLVLESYKIKNKVETAIVPRTADDYCPFLKEDLSCAIYKDRPFLCKKFGDETHPMMCCPVQHKDGKPRKEHPQNDSSSRKLAH